VILQACEGGRLSISQASAGLAPHIVQQGVPIVIAMQYEVEMWVARLFALEFYRRLSQWEPVDKAVQEARREIELHMNDQPRRDFATPVLFSNIDDGRIFEFSQRVPSASERSAISSQIRFYKKMPDGRGEPVVSHGDVVRIGRKPGSQLQLPINEPGVSWEHGSVIFRQSGFVYQHDSNREATKTRIIRRGEEILLSKNGPTKEVLHNQDLLIIGSCTYIIEIDLNSKDDIGYIGTA
jgi:hypothetical protein